MTEPKKRNPKRPPPFTEEEVASIMDSFRKMRRHVEEIDDILRARDRTEYDFCG